MSTTFTISGTGYVPLLVDGYQARRRSRNVLHPILGSAGHAVALRPAALRSGTYRTLFTTEAGALAFHTALATAATIAVTSTDRSTIAATIVMSGDARLTLDGDTRDHWWVEFDYQEITP